MSDAGTNRTDRGPNPVEGIVPHVTSTLYGGAAIAAHRICAAQRSAGIEAQLFFRESEGSPDPQTSVPHHAIPTTRRRIMASKSLSAVNRVLKRRQSVLFTPFAYSLSVSELRRLLPSSRILALHNLYNVTTLRMLRRAFPDAHLAVTLHDERTLTSGCHYTQGCERYISGCSSCPQCRLPLPIRRFGDDLHQMLLSDANVSFVAPSRWLRGQAIQAGLDPVRVAHIANPIDPQIFGLRSSTPLSRTDVLTVGWLPGKGESQFWEAMSQVRALLAPARLRVRTTTHTLKAEGVEIDIFPKLATELDRACFWSGADIGVCLTRADNFPNVVLEALSVGTPFIINGEGGAGEAIRDTGGGEILERAHPSELAQALVRAVSSPETWQRRGAEAARRVREIYSPQVIGAQYEQHYRSALRVTGQT